MLDPSGLPDRSDRHYRLLIGTAAFVILAVSGTRLIQVLPEYQERAQSLQKDLERLLVAQGIEPERVFSLEMVNPGRLLGLAAGFLSGLGRVLSQVLLLLLIVGFFLAERGLHTQTFQPGGTV